MSVAEKVVRIGGASAFLLDSALAVPQLLQSRGLDYLIFDYLAEGSMGLLGRMQAADPKGGFGTDFLTVHVGPHLQEIARQGVKVIANAGGLNPHGLAAATETMIKAAGLSLRVATVDGDDVRAFTGFERTRGMAGAKCPGCIDGTGGDSFRWAHAEVCASQCDHRLHAVGWAGPRIEIGA
jgi:hypothetical protein